MCRTVPEIAEVFEIPEMKCRTAESLRRKKRVEQHQNQEDRKYEADECRNQECGKNPDHEEAQQAQ